MRRRLKSISTRFARWWRCRAIRATASRSIELAEEVRIDAAYGGSCTGGKMADMDMYAEVLQNALAQGKRVAPGVHLYLQFGSQKIKQYARERGYIEIFERAGAELIDPSCGACINAGPGASRLCRDRHRQRAKQKLPRPQRPRQTLPRLALRRRCFSNRREDRRATGVPSRARRRVS